MAFVREIEAGRHRQLRIAVGHVDGVVRFGDRNLGEGMRVGMCCGTALVGGFLLTLQRNLQMSDRSGPTGKPPRQVDRAAQRDAGRTDGDCRPRVEQRQETVPDAEQQRDADQLERDQEETKSYAPFTFGLRLSRA